MDLNTKNSFLRSEIPYQKLEECGISQEMFDDFPEDVINALLRGRLSPVIPALIKGENGRQWKNVKFAFERTINDTAGLIFFPQFDTTRLEDFTNDEQHRLLQGETIIYKKNEEISYAQLDTELNQIISASKDTIAYNAAVYGVIYGLDEDEILQMANINIIETTKDEMLMSLGIDLTEPTGVRVVEGGKLLWIEERNRQLPMYNFGIYGCWVNKNGTLEYIKEENYTQEMWNEMERAGVQNSAKSHIGR